MSTILPRVTIHATADLGAQLRAHRERLRLAQATAAALRAVSTRAVCAPRIAGLERLMSEGIAAFPVARMLPPDVS